MKEWFARYKCDDYPFWAYLVAILTLGIAIKPLEVLFRRKKWKN